MADAIEFSFYPLGFFLDGHKNCQNEGGRGDAGCEMDKLESCMVTQLCLNGNCTSATARSLVDFLGCFENDKGDNKSVDTAKGCASDTGLDLGPTLKCYNDADAKEAAYKQVQDAARAATGANGEAMWSSMKCVPWVWVDGALFSDASVLQCVPHQDGDAFTKAICDRYTGRSRPAACSHVAAA